jgi:hypothetical protein
MALTSSAGLTLSTPGQTVNGLRITGNVEIQASNVTIENSIIQVTDPTAFYGINVLGGLTGIVIKHCTIVGPGAASTTPFYGIRIIYNSQVTIDSLNIHDIAHAVQIGDGEIVIQNSYFHGLNSVSSTHYEDILYSGGGSAKF